MKKTISRIKNFADDRFVRGVFAGATFAGGCALLYHQNQVLLSIPKKSLQSIIDNESSLIFDLPQGTLILRGLNLDG